MISNEKNMPSESIESREYYNYFFEILKRVNIKLDEYGIYKTEDINIVLYFLSLLLNKKHPHTANFSIQVFMSDVCSIENIDNSHLIFHSFKSFDFMFKFKSMVILSPNNHRLSPLIFFEAKNDKKISEKERENLEKYEEKKYINIFARCKMKLK